MFINVNKIAQLTYVNNMPSTRVICLTTQTMLKKEMYNL